MSSADIVQLSRSHMRLHGWLAPKRGGRGKREEERGKRQKAEEMTLMTFNKHSTQESLPKQQEATTKDGTDKERERRRGKREKERGERGEEAQNAGNRI